MGWEGNGIVVECAAAFSFLLLGAGAEIVVLKVEHLWKDLKSSTISRFLGSFFSHL
jgi:hypothetical protein